MGIRFLVKTFFPSHFNKWKLPFSINIKVIMSSLLVSIVLIAGVYMVVKGFQENYSLEHRTKGYKTTQGYFVDYDIYQVNSDGQETNRWYYEYEVDGQIYHTKTDYGSSSIPEYGSQGEVKYNPVHPEQSVLVGTNSSMMMVMIGAFFVLIGMVFVLVGCQSLGLFDKVHFDIIGSYVGFVFLSVGIGVFYFQTRTSSLIEGIKMMGLWILIPLLFIGTGVFQ